MVSIAMAISIFRIKCVFENVETEFSDLGQTGGVKYCAQVKVLGDTSMNRLIPAADLN